MHRNDEHEEAPAVITASISLKAPDRLSIKDYAHDDFVPMHEIAPEEHVQELALAKREEQKACDKDDPVVVASSIENHIEDNANSDGGSHVFSLFKPGSSNSSQSFGGSDSKTPPSVEAKISATDVAGERVSKRLSTHVSSKTIQFRAPKTIGEALTRI